MWPYYTGYEEEVDPAELELAKVHLIGANKFTKVYANSNAVTFDKDKYSDLYLTDVYRDDGQDLINQYWRDLALVKRFIGRKAMIEAGEINKKRDELTDKIKTRYDTREKRAELADCISIILTYRCGLPFCQTIESRAFRFPSPKNDAPAFLAVSDAPNTFDELKEYLADHPDPESESTVPTRFLILAALFSGSDDSRLATVHWHKWSERTAETDPYLSPYTERFRMLWAYLANYSAKEIHGGMEELRSIIYSSHPICMGLHTLEKPYVLADIVRQANYGKRDEHLQELIQKVIDQILESQSQLADDFYVNRNARDLEAWNPGEYRYYWNNYKPLVIQASSEFHNNRHELRYVCDKLILPAMYAESPRAIFDNMIFTAMLLLQFTGAVGVISSRVATIGMALLESGDIALNVRDLYQSFIKNPHLQKRENLLKILDEDIVAFENGSSRLSAMGGFLIGAFFAIDEYKDFFLKPMKAANKAASNATEKAIKEIPPPNPRGIPSDKGLGDKGVAKKGTHGHSIPMPEIIPETPNVAPKNQSSKAGRIAPTEAPEPVYGAHLDMNKLQPNNNKTKGTKGTKGTNQDARAVVNENTLIPETPRKKAQTPLKNSGESYAEKTAAGIEEHHRLVDENAGATRTYDPDLEELFNPHQQQWMVPVNPAWEQERVRIAAEIAAHKEATMMARDKSQAIPEPTIDEISVSDRAIGDRGVTSSSAELQSFLENLPTNDELLTWNKMQSLAKGTGMDPSVLWQMYKRQHGITAKLAKRASNMGPNVSIHNKGVWEGMIERGLRKDELGPKVDDFDKDFVHPAHQGAVRLFDELDEFDVPTGEQVFKFYDENTREWHYVNGEAQLGHIEDAVAWWNREGYKYGPRSKEVRDWMTNLDNYVFEYWETNAQKGARFSEEYREPL